MAGPLSAEWLHRQIAAAPAALRERTRWFIEQAGGGTDPASLAAASRAALAAAVVRANDRAGALDLLVADCLVTLALAAQVEDDPADLGRFATSLRGLEAPVR